MIHVRGMSLMTMRTNLFRQCWLPVMCITILVGCSQPMQDASSEQGEQQMEQSNSRDLIANNAFFYYSDLDAAWRFYGETLGFETVADYGFAKIMQVASTSYLTLVEAKAGMKDAFAPKTVAVAFVTDELDEWYEYLLEAGVTMKSSSYSPTPGSPHDGFVALDSEGYFLEFERFNEHPGNERLMPMLNRLESLHVPETCTTNRPSNLGVKATVLWLYSNNVHAMSDFYEEVMGFEMVVDQGWAMVHASSPSGFIGPVDGAEGMHQWTENKAVMLSLLTTDIDGWFDHLKQQPRFGMRDAEVGVESRAGARVFVGHDPDGYLIELDEFFAAEGNEVLLAKLAG